MLTQSCVGISPICRRRIYVKKKHLHLSILADELELHRERAIFAYENVCVEKENVGTGKNSYNVVQDKQRRCCQVTWDARQF